MRRNSPIFVVIFTLILATLACSTSSLQSKANNAEKTANAFRTQVGGVVSQGNSLLQTARAVETQHPGILATVEAVGTHAAPLLGTLQAVGTNSPGLVQTAQALIQNKLPTGQPPDDIPIYNRDLAQDFFGSSQYIFYSSPSQYAQVLNFYQVEMPHNGWQYVESASHLYSNAAELKFSKDNRNATVNLSLNPLNNTTVIVIDVSTG